MLRLLSFLLVASATLLPAQDDRDRTTKTAAIWQTDVTAADVNTLTAAGWRFTDVEIESTSPWEFTVSAVPNTGTYAKAWWFVYGVTAAQLTASLSANNARLVDIEPYDDAGTTRFAALMIANTGADQKAWAWYYNQTGAQLSANVTANNGRLTCFERYATGGGDRYATVMIANSGADFRNWGYLFGATAAQISANVQQNGNRIYGMERVAADSFDVILVEHTNFGWWWGIDLTASQVTELLQQNIGRLVDVERHTLPLLGTRYTAVVLDNANTLERTARQAFYAAPAAALGDYGFFLKEVNGPVLAEMRADTVFEPASTMKTLYHVHAMRRVSLGLASLNTMINKPIACGVPGGNQTLEQTLSEMMEVSDNMSTLAVSNHFGLANIDATATALGMTSTNVNFTIGCSGPSPENELTLRDLSTLHEQVANGYLGGQRAKFYELMAESLSFPSWGTEDLGSRIDAEAATLGLPAVVRDAFKNALHIAYKPGGVGWTQPGQWTYYYAEGGWMSVPFKNAAGTIVPHEYTFGVFNYLFYQQANEIPGRNAMSQAELEIVWDRVKAALQTWDNHVPGQFVPLIGAGCPGSNGTPLHQAAGTPEIAATAQYAIANAPGATIAVAMFGFDNVMWNGAPLPLNLGLVGAPNCLLRIDAVVFDATITTSGGTGLVSIAFPNVPALIGAQLYSQFLVYDPPANAFDWTISNAIRTTLGGYL